jgi:HIV Tat-specific factor 1
VTSLPRDTEVDELLQRFGKCGVIEEDDEGEPKIKMYAREDGTFSGEALVVFFKEDSVTLAVNLMDEAELRLGNASTRMRVQKAEFGHKQQQRADGQAGGEERKVVNRKKATKRIGKMQRCGLRKEVLLNQTHRELRKLEDWDSEDEFGPTLTEMDKLSNQANKNGRVVVLKHMFTLQELDEDPSLLLDLKDDVREECAILGDVTNVVLYDVREFFFPPATHPYFSLTVPFIPSFLQQEPQGVMTVKFRDPISAKACIIVGRFFYRRLALIHLPIFRKCKAGSSPAVG